MNTPPVQKQTVKKGFHLQKLFQNKKKKNTLKDLQYPHFAGKKTSSILDFKEDTDSHKTPYMNTKRIIFSE